MSLAGLGLTPWTAAKMGPRRDVIGELAKAVRAEGIVFGLSSHRVEHWWFFDEGKTFDSDVRDPKNSEFYGPAATLASGSTHLPGEIASVALLGSNTDLRWRRDAEGLHIDLPDRRPTPMPPAMTFKIGLR